MTQPPHTAGPEEFIKSKCQYLHIEILVVIMIRGIYRGVFNSVLMDDQYLKGCVVFIVEQGLGKTRAGILSKQVEVHGGCVVKTTPTLDDLTHIVVSEKMTSLDKVCKILKVSAVPTCVEVVKADWLSACLVAGQRLEAMPYFIRSAPDPTKVRKRQSTEIEAESVKIAKLDDSNDDLPSTLSNKVCKGEWPLLNTCIISIDHTHQTTHHMGCQT